MNKTPKITVKKEYAINIGSPCFILFCIFLILKLTGAISWSWWWVTSPLWIGAALVLGFIGLIFAFFLVIGIAAVIIALLQRK